MTARRPDSTSLKRRSCCGYGLARIYELIDSGQLRAYKVDKRIRLRPVDVEQYRAPPPGGVISSGVGAGWRGDPRSARLRTPNRWRHRWTQQSEGHCARPVWRRRCGGPRPGRARWIRESCRVGWGVWLTYQPQLTHRVYVNYGWHMSPFRPKARHAGVDQAVSRAVAYHSELQKLERKRDRLLVLRGTAIARALDRGATLRELGDRLGITAEAVRKMALAHRAKAVEHRSPPSNK
jgi:hypothetical protein